MVHAYRAQLPQDGGQRSVVVPRQPRRRFESLVLDKLLRAIGDAMNGIVYVDDSRIVKFSECKKEYVRDEEDAGVQIYVEGL